MKLKQLWIVLAMILLSVSSYSQYPTTKKIKGDSVVIMTIGQADTINKLYKSYNDTIIAYKDSLSLKNNLYVYTTNRLRSKEDSVNIYRFHIQNIKPDSGIDKDFKDKFEQEQGLNRLWTLLLFVALALIKI
jgi:hypothetical protein